MKLNLSLGQRISLGFVLLVGLVLATSGIGLWLITSVNATAEATQSQVDLWQDAVAVERAWTDVTAVIDRMLLTRQTGGQIKSQLETSVANFEQLLAQLGEKSADALSDTAQSTNIDTLRILGDQLVSRLNEVSDVAGQGGWARAQVIRHTEISSLQSRFDENLAAYADELDNAAKSLATRQTRTQNLIRISWIVGVALAVVGGVLSAYYTLRSITLPIHELIQQTQRLKERKFDPIMPLARHDEIGELSRAFAEMNELLRQFYQDLEQRVSERTRALATSAQVSRSLSTILDPDQLVIEVVEQIKQAFNYYHAHIYIFDDQRDKLVMAGGTGEAGRALLAAGHEIAKNKGLVGRAAVRKQVVHIPDVTQDSDWLPNMLLPDTKSEVAVPIAIGEEVIGVLDVQHNVVNGLTNDDVALLQSIADQVGVALKNAYAYADARAQVEREAVINEIGRRIQTATDVDMVLQIATREIGKALNAKQVDVQIGKAAAGNGRFSKQNAI